MHRHTQVLLYNTYYSLDLFSCVCGFLEPASKMAPNDPCLLGVVWSPLTLFQGWFVWQWRKSLLRFAFQRLPIPFWLLSLSLIACSGGSPITSSPMERVLWWGAEVSCSEPGEQAWTCLLQSLSNLQRPQPWPTAWPQPHKRLWARTTRLSFLLPPIPWSLETDQEDTRLWF